MAARYDDQEAWVDADSGRCLITCMGSWAQKELGIEEHTMNANLNDHKSMVETKQCHVEVMKGEIDAMHQAGPQ
ncbi:hypothetical protein Ancab_032158, partial [Ancistrocladus abbreviatus]